MQKRILANLHHSVFHPYPVVQHQFCESSRCPFASDQNEGTSNYNHKETQKKRLPQSFLPHLLPLYQRLSEHSLSVRCVGGLTQNQTEDFNATIWRQCPKERAFGPSSVKRAVHLAVVSWNTGRSSYEQILTTLGLDYNHLTIKAVQAKDKNRFSQAAKYIENKNDRKRKNQEKNRAELAKKKQFGDDHQPGQY